VTKHHITKHLKEDEVATEENEVPDCPATDSTDEEVTKGLDCRKHEEKPSPWVQTAGAEGQPQRRRRRYQVVRTVKGRRKQATETSRKHAESPREHSTTYFEKDPI